jgi:L-methionine (R)-S-oxide reductase
MAEDLVIQASEKSARYRELMPQLKALCEGEVNFTANLANIAAGLKEAFGFFWVGFYLADTPDELVLGPFQGPVACTRIQKGKGVCGSSWAQQKTLLVSNVEEFPGHIACSSLSKSEIVVPIYTTNRFIGVLDVDSDQLNDFDEVDERYLTEICKWIATLFK